MSTLPKGWEEVELGEIAEVTAGQSPPGSDVNEMGNGLPFFQGKAEFGDLYPKVRKWTNNPSRVANTGDILLSVRAPVGPTNLATTECAIGRGLMAIRGRSWLADRYLMWAIRASAEQLRYFATGSTFEAVTGPVVRKHLIPVAPRPEQERIVAAMEEAFSKLDAGEAGLLTVRQLLKRMRDAVLAAAVAGQLVPQDPTETPASQFLAGLGVESGDCEDYLPKGWCGSTIGDVISRIEAGKSFASLGRPAAPNEVGVVKVSAMTWGEFPQTRTRRFPPASLSTRFGEFEVVICSSLVPIRANM